jgi:hypothetical protein
VLAVAYNLKVFFTAAGRPPDTVTTADVLAFMTAQRAAARSECLWKCYMSTGNGVGCHSCLEAAQRSLWLLG